MPTWYDGRGKPRPYREENIKRSIFVPTLYLTEEYAFVRRDSEDMLLVQIPERRGKDGSLSQTLFFYKHVMEEKCTSLEQGGDEENTRSSH